MNTAHHDKTFIVTFLAVLAFLFSFTVGISFIARTVSAEGEHDDKALARIEERIKPVGQVITDEKMLLAAVPAAAARAPMTGPEIVTKVCGACHGTGVLGAPKIGDKGAWASRGKLATLVASAMKGKNQMPPKGGDPSLSEDEIKAAVQEMTK